MNIEGQVRQLPLFAPPIDPALLVRASAAGLEISSIISGLYAPLPKYRFSFMLQKALEICGEVRNLGSSLLAALDKKDGEELSLLRSAREVNLLQAVRELKKKSIEEAESQESLASGLSLLPNIHSGAAPSISLGGSNLGAAAQSIAGGYRANANAQS